MSDFQQHFIKIAIEIYGLELDPDRVDIILADWLKQYDPSWILKAIVESLYRGRYKIVSVENILKDWQRLGNPRYQFTPEYEREILEKIPQVPTPEVSSTHSSPADIPVATNEVLIVSSIPSESDKSTLYPLTCKLAPMPQVLMSSKDLNPEESAPFQSHYHSLSLSYSDTPVENSDNSEELNLDLTCISEDTSPEDRDPARFALTLDPLPRRSRFPNRYERSKIEHITSVPASRKLFNTLKAIVDPNYQDRSEVRSWEPFPLLAGNDRLSKIANFMPIDSPNEERHL